MAIQLLALPYPQNALAPYLSAETLRLHHGAHYKGYVDKVNAAIKDGPQAQASLNRIVIETAGKDQKLFNSAAQAWNHGFYWHSMSPQASKPSDALEAAIDRDFGSIAALRAALSAAAEEHFASGWAWLVAAQGKLAVVTTHDADTPITGKANPLLVIDLWEHAYYIDHRYKRPDYVKDVIGKLNWSFASDNFARGTAWIYPE